jgi:hypothetical protein
VKKMIVDSSEKINPQSQDVQFVEKAWQVPSASAQLAELRGHRELIVGLLRRIVGAVRTWLPVASEACPPAGNSEGNTILQSIKDDVVLVDAILEALRRELCHPLNVTSYVLSRWPELRVALISILTAYETLRDGWGDWWMVDGPLPKRSKLLPIDPRLLGALEKALAGFELFLNQAIDSLLSATDIAPSRIEQYVTLDQLAAVASRSKRTLEKYKSRRENPLPLPAVTGGGGKPDEWVWADVRPWLEREFGRRLPERFPQQRPLG